MFCYQCEQTAKGTGCTVQGVCGKDATTAALQDVLVYLAKGGAQYAHRAREAGAKDRDADVFVIEALFTTVTNVNFDPDRELSARVIFPNSPAESHGIEDARFVAFREEDDTVTYHATYTAFDGRVFLPQMLTTRDFCHFRISTLNGPAVQNKGMALFPRKIHGRYAMLGRQDNENLFLMYSDLLHFWYSKQLLIRPTYPWEFVQLGNCGSPIETEAGWLVLTHGVGPMRRYVISASTRVYPRERRSNIRFQAASMRPSSEPGPAPRPPRSRAAHRIGVRVNDMNSETSVTITMVTAKGRKNRPTMLPIMATGNRTTTLVPALARTAMATSPAPIRAASEALSRVLIRLTMLSSTTIEFVTRIPTDSPAASSVDVFSV